MADLTIVAGSVAPVTTAGTGIIPTTTARGIAGAAISPGQSVYSDPSASNLIKPALATNQLQAANIVGIALGSANPNQPVTYATGGDIILPTGVGGTLLSGSAYVVSGNTAGGIAPSTDMTSGNFVTLLGLGNGTASGVTNYLRLGIIPAAVPR